MRVRTRTETRYWVSYCVTCARSFRMCYIVFFFSFFYAAAASGRNETIEYPAGGGFEFELNSTPHRAPYVYAAAALSGAPSEYNNYGVQSVFHLIIPPP